MPGHLCLSCQGLKADTLREVASAINSFLSSLTSSQRAPWYHCKAGERRCVHVLTSGCSNAHCKLNRGMQILEEKGQSSALGGFTQP